MPAEISAIVNQWKNIIHLHIPKCGGTNFFIPIHELFNWLYFHTERKQSNINNKIFYRQHLDSMSKLQLFLEIQKSYQENINLSGGLISVQGASWHEIRDQNNKFTSAQNATNTICVVRDPRERLRQHLMMDGEHFHSIQSFKSSINEKIYRFANCMDKYIYNYGLIGSKYSKPYCDPTDYELVRDIHFIGFDDLESISMIKSAFLSANQLPNIIHYDDANDQRPRIVAEGSLSEDQINSVYQECLEMGFLDRDCQIDFDILKDQSREDSLI